MSNDILINYHRHQGPMCGVLERYKIGQPDKFNRGIWINENDLSEILEKMRDDPTKQVAGGHLFVQGTNKHNHVFADDFIRLFGKG